MALESKHYCKKSSHSWGQVKRSFAFVIAIHTYVYKHFTHFMVLYTEECTGNFSPFADDSPWVVEWTVRGDMIDFVIYANDFGWVGIGFSDDPLMVSICL